MGERRARPSRAPVCGHDRPTQSLRMSDWLRAVRECAVSRTDGIATRGGRSSGSMTPRRTTDLDPKGRGDKSLLVKRGTAEDVYAVVLQRLSDTAKTGLCESQSPGVEPHTRRQHI